MFLHKYENNVDMRTTLCYYLVNEDLNAQLKR